MSNVFKKFIKKRKRARMQAKNEKAVRASGRNDEDYQQQLSRHRHAVIRKSVVTVAAVIAAAAALLIFIEKEVIAAIRPYKRMNRKMLFLISMRSWPEKSSDTVRMVLLL